MRDAPLQVLLIGATGVFGSLLARSLVREPGVRTVLAGRRAAALSALAGELGKADTLILDRDHLSAGMLRGFHLVIDAAGPFQDSRTSVIEAAIEAGCHYLDLADGRAFVTGIARFDVAARTRGIFVLSGASSTPALTNAVIDRLTRGWRSIATIRVTISPGSAVRGPSLISGVLSYLGRPVRVFREGGWTRVPGWGGRRVIEIPALRQGVGSLCETPDLDLFVERHAPTATAEFMTSLEVPLMHWGMTGLAMLVRWRLMSRPERWVGPLRWLAGLAAPLGANRGGMVVEVSGADAAGQAVFARWSLRAPPDMGPNVPTLAALALVRRLRDGDPPAPGARPCVGVLDLDEFATDFERLGMETQSDIVPLGRPLFARALGAAFDALPATNRHVHSPAPVRVLHGRAQVEGARSALGRLIARLFGLPSSMHDVPLRVVIEATSDGRECWSRVYPDRVMRSIMGRPDPATRTIEEHVGAFRFGLRIDPNDEGLSLVLVGGRLWRMPLPDVLLPRIAATETVDGDRHLFDVAIGLPLLGRIVRYRGWLH